jgi:hypothetical protein
MVRICTLLALVGIVSPLVAQDRSTEVFPEKPVFDDESIDRRFEQTSARLVSFEEEAEVSSLCNEEDGCKFCDDSCPDWTFRAGVITLRRGDNVNPFGGFPFDAEPDSGIGYYVSAIHHGETFDLEGVFFGVGDMDAHISIPMLADASFDSEIYSYEFNIKRALSHNFSVLAGFRVLDIDSRTTLGIPMLGTILGDVDNDLYGAQIGAEAVLLRTQRFRFDAIWKAGIYHNEIEVEASGGFIPGVVQISTGENAYSTDLWLSMAYQLNDSAALRWGYQILWVDNIADSLPFFGPGDLGNESALYHGLHAMLEFTR